MAPKARFADIKFNLMRAIEFFEDMNALDMDVTAPPSDHTYFKEIEVAQRLNILLGQLIQEGVFDDCDERDEECSSDEEQQEEGEQDEESQDVDGARHSHSHSHTRSGSNSRTHSHSNSPSRSHSQSRSHSSEQISPRSEGFDYQDGRDSADTENQGPEFYDDE